MYVFTYICIYVYIDMYICLHIYFFLKKKYIYVLFWCLPFPNLWGPHQNLGLSSLIPQTAPSYVVIDSDSDHGGAAENDNDNDDVDQHSGTNEECDNDIDNDDLEIVSDSDHVTEELPEHTTDDILETEHPLPDLQSHSHQHNIDAESGPIPDPVPHVEEPQRAPKRMRKTAHQSAPALGISREKKYTSPDILREISPPGCRITLNTNEHRFTSAWKRSIECEAWVDELANKSYSQSFNSSVTDDWKLKLAAVHSYAWTKWSIAVDHCTIPELQLPTGAVEPTPGMIPEDVYQQLSPSIQTLPARKQYSKR